MKFSTGSSSSSLASDSLSRKSTLCIYTEAEAPAPPPYERMDSSSEAMELRRELETTRSALQQQSEAVLRQRHQLAETTLALGSRAHRAERERRLRADQLALVLRSLVLLESRLAREQKQIQASLQQKDAVIKAQQDELEALKARKTYCANCQVGFTSEQTNVETDPEFHSLESTDSRVPNFVRSCSYRERDPPAFQKNTRLSKSFQLPREATSSSEEGAAGTFVKNKQAFVRRDVFRRSRKYSGRKHNSKYLENVQSGYAGPPAHSSSADDCAPAGYPPHAAPNQISKDIRRASLKIDQLIGENVSNSQQNAPSDIDKSYSAKMERFHGIKRQASDEIKVNRQMFLNNVLHEESSPDKPWYCNVSDPEQDTDNSLQRVNVNNPSKTKAEDSTSRNAFESGILNAEVISAKNAVLCNNVTNNLNGACREDKNNNKGDNVDSFAPANEISENWYASASDPDEAPSHEIYKNNPVLECVNQILLQNSLDDSSNDNSKSSEVQSPKTSTKRVQFSTLNSISCDESARALHTLPRADRRANKIVKFSLETASEHSYEVPHTAQGYQYEIQSIYSNDYEPIATKEQPRPAPPPAEPRRGNIVKSLAASIERHYQLDERASMKMFNKRKVPRTPPALPPKPKNLSAKLKEQNPAKPEPMDSEAVAANQRVADVNTRNAGQAAAAEPDYCSISEINVPVVSHGPRELLLSQPTVELHRVAPPAPAPAAVAKVVSLARIQTQAKLADKDLPKLPQVTEIIIPEDDPPAGAFPPYKPAKLDRSIQMGNTVSSILSEINLGGPAKLSLTELDGQYGLAAETAGEYFEDKFDLSQNFEEFKIDEELAGSAEEYRISSASSDGSAGEAPARRAPRKEAKQPAKNCKLSNKPDLLSNIENVETDADSSSSSSGSYNTVKCEPAAPLGPKAAKVSFDFFLETSGLSSKSIVTPTRPARPPSANHKHALKPRDIKMRVRTAASKAADKPMTTAIKYFEPYV